MSYRFAIPIAIALLACAPTSAAPPGVSVEVLLETEKTILGEPFVYPNGMARITAAIVTVPPRATIPSHLHPVPLFAYILQGVLVVDYGSKGVRTYRKGDTFVEAYQWSHHARNGGRGNVKILAVYAGAAGVDNSVPVE